MNKHDAWCDEQALPIRDHLGSPTPEQIDHDILEQLSLFRQKIADLETAKEFNGHIQDNILERLNNLEKEFLRVIELYRLKGNG